MRIIPFLILALALCGCEKEPLLKDQTLQIPNSYSYKWAIINGRTKKEINYTINNQKTKVTHRHYKSFDDKVYFSIPLDWEIIYDSTTVLLCKFGKSQESFFAFGLTPKDGIGLLSFRNYMLHDMASDTNEVFNYEHTNYVVQEDTLAFWMYFNSVRGGKEREYYTYIAEDQANILDLTMRVVEEDFSVSRLLDFYSVVSSFRLNGIPVQYYEEEEKTTSWKLRFGR